MKQCCVEGGAVAEGSVAESRVVLASVAGTGSVEGMIRATAGKGRDETRRN